MEQGGTDSVYKHETSMNRKYLKLEAHENRSFTNCLAGRESY